MAKRRRIGDVPAVDAETAELGPLYRDEQIPVAEIAVRLGRTAGEVRGLIARHELPARPRAQARLADDTIDVAVACRLYATDGLSLREVAERLGTTPDKVRVRLSRAGVELRAPGRHPWVTPLDRDWLADAYANRRLSDSQIAAEAGCSPAHVRNELRRHGIRRRRGPAPLPPGWTPLTPEVLRQLYEVEALTIAEVAERVGGSPARVLAALHRAGIETRAPGTPSGRRLTRLTPELLHRLYVEEGLSAAQVAERVGGDGNRVRAALVRAGIPRRPRTRPLRPVNATRQDLVDRYVDQRASLDELAREYGTSVNQVRLRLRAEGIRRPLPPPPVPKPPPPEELRRFYVEEGRTLAQLVAHYHVGRDRVRGWLIDAGITVAPRTSRAHRRQLPVDQMSEWYWEDGCTAADIAERLDTTVNLVLRALHDAGVRVRLGGPRRDPDEAMCVLDQLYADPAVGKVLRRHRVPRRLQPGPIAERFPAPAPTTRALLEELYVGVGLSARHIELLIGQPAGQVLDALHAYDLPVRPVKSFSPWRQRQLSG